MTSLINGQTLIMTVLALCSHSVNPKHQDDKPVTFYFYSQKLLIFIQNTHLKLAVLIARPMPNSAESDQRLGSAGGVVGHYSTADSRSIALGTLIYILCTISLLAAYRGFLATIRNNRTRVCLNNESQTVYTERGSWHAFVKAHLLYSPLFKKRHQYPVRLKKWELGILPTRAQTLFLAAILGLNIGFCFPNVTEQQARNSNHASMLVQLRHRSGTLAIVNMIPLVIMAGRNNPLIILLRISFDTFNLIHRWSGRMVIAQSLVHSIAWGAELADPKHSPGLDPPTRTISSAIVVCSVCSSLAQLIELNLLGHGRMSGYIWSITEAHSTFILWVIFTFPYYFGAH